MVVKFLLAEGAHIEQRSVMQETALMCVSGKAECSSRGGTPC